MTEGQPEEYSQENLHELVGGIKNSIDRGEELNKVKQSFINAGYGKEEIEDATAMLGLSENIVQQKIIPPNKKEITKPLPTIAKLPVKKSIISKPFPKKIVFPSTREVQKLPVAKFTEPTKLNKVLVIILILLGILFVVIAGFLGVFWDQLFGPF